MQLTNEILADARALKSTALQELLSSGYAPARRIAHALSGNARIGSGVAELLLLRSLKMLSRWQDASSPENWFYHHAVLTTRTVNFPPPNPLEDPLVIHGEPNDPAYVAFVRAIRNLPPQQREAFILHHGERLNPRLLAVAMDCSTQAAATHLAAATEAIKSVTMERADAFASALTRAYASLRQSEPKCSTAVRVHVRNVRRRVWLRRITLIAMIVSMLAALGWIAWNFFLK